MIAIEALGEIIFWGIVALVVGVVGWLACCNDKSRGGMYRD